MNLIIVIKERSWSQVEELFRKVELHGDSKVLPYKRAKIESRVMEFNEVKPLSLYVLKQKIDFQEKLREQFLKQRKIDTLDLNGKRGGLVFRLKGEKKEWKMVPPIVEISKIDGGVPVLLDGQHRFLLAKKLGLPIRVVWIEKVLEDVPVIAKPVEWTRVKKLTKVPEVVEKRDFRYKRLKDFPDISRFSKVKITEKNRRYFFYRDLNEITSSAVRRFCEN